MNTSNYEWIDECGRFADICIPGRPAVTAVCSGVLAGLSGEKRVLVIGGGAGNELILLAKAHPALHFVVVGIPFPMAVMFRHRVQVEGLKSRIIVLDTTFLDYMDDQPFELAISMLGLKHVSTEEDLDKYIGKLSQLLVQNGKVIALEMYYPEDASDTDIFQCWKNQVASRGMEIEHADGLLSQVRLKKSVLNEQLLENCFFKEGFAAVLKVFSSYFYGIWIATLAEENIQS